MVYTKQPLEGKQTILASACLQQKIETEISFVFNLLFITLCSKYSLSQQKRN